MATGYYGEGGAGGGSGPDLSDATPAALGVASAGVSTEASRADHVHLAPVGGGVAIQDASYYRHVGTTPFESWYTSDISASTFTARTSLINTMVAYPFVSSRGGTLDRIGFNVAVASGAGGVMRLGIYAATSATNLYPNELLVESGALVTTGTGVVSATINQAIAANTLYWLVSLAGVSVTGTNSGYGGINLIILGSPAPGSIAQIGISVAQAYGAMPATFPVGGAAITTVSNSVAVFVRYSA